MFKNWQIRNLQISIATTKAELEVLNRIVNQSSTVEGYYVDKLIAHSGKLASLEKRLDLLQP